MPRPRSETTLDDRGRARRTRERRAEYVAALEATIYDAGEHYPMPKAWWDQNAEAIRRVYAARQAQQNRRH